MRISLSLVVFAASAMSGISKTQVNAGGEHTGGRLDQLIDQLNDNEFAVRELASKELWEMGRSALPKLLEASESGDPETMQRARKLIHKFELFLSPESDPKLIELVERYQTAPSGERQALLQQLRAMRAWPQMLKLYAEEKNEAIRDL